jgi:hypothetical protein
MRPHLPDAEGRPTAEPPPAAPATPLQDLLVPLELDPLTVGDDEDFVDTLAKEQNLPPEIGSRIRDCF